MAAVTRRTGVLVIRLWLEEEFGGAAVRARIMQTSDASLPGSTTVAAPTEPEILEAVRAWLRAFAQGGDVSVTRGL